MSGDVLLFIYVRAQDRALLYRDLRRARFDGIARAVGDNAVKLNAVPCGVGRDGFTGVRASVPLAERSLSGFLEVPLVSQTVALGFERKRDGIAELDCFVCGLGGYFQFPLNCDGGGVGI